MTKQLFLNELSAALHTLPRDERYRTLSYYDELIDDRMEDGQSEEEAVSSLGDPAKIAREILGEEEAPVSTGTGRKVWLIVLLVLGFPLWGSLVLAAALLLLCVYICLFLPAFLLGVFSLSFLAGAVVGVVGAPFLVFDVGLLSGGVGAGLFQLGASVTMLGLAVLCALGFYFTGKFTVKAGKNLWRWLRKSLVKKGRVAV